MATLKLSFDVQFTLKEIAPYVDAVDIAEQLVERITEVLQQVATPYLDEDSSLRVAVNKKKVHLSLSLEEQEELKDE